MNIKEILDEINNYFDISVEHNNDVEFDGNNINFEYKEHYIIGQYILIENSILNDGVYKIKAVFNNQITVEEPLQTEQSNKTINIYALAIPNEFITLADEIIKYGKYDNVQSETVSRYSVTYGEQGSSWVKVYGNALNKWRKIRWC